jgi:hypothetical protein
MNEKLPREELTANFEALCKVKAGRKETEEKITVEFKYNKVCY